MLLNTSELLYNPSVHLTQTELMEKFNLAFYESQNLTKNDHTNFSEPEIRDDYLIEYLISNNEPSDGDFDFNDFVRTFDENLCQSDASTGSTRGLSEILESPLDNLDLEDIDLCDGLSNESLDLDNLASELQDLDEQRYALPPISTIGRTGVDFTTYLRSVPEDSLGYFEQESRSEFGHLIGTRCLNNNKEDIQEYQLSDNQVVLSRNEALMDLNDDPLLSSSSLMYRRKNPSESESSTGDEEVSSSSVLQCQWEHCYQIYDSQSALVKHIEKCHVEVKRGEEFTCFWANCPRKVKPFNARYKLLIHMRVHSGEKPNKCPFDGCNKAFSRLENLKIHQRSHTGERPYLCQFPTCTKSFSNSSDRAKHQRTHFDTKPYACQVVGCTKKYTDPSSLRKHVKNHSNEEQMLIKKKSHDEGLSSAYVRKFFDPNRQKAVKSEKREFYGNVEHNYSNYGEERKYDSSGIRQDLKNKISEKNRLRSTY
ncbi:hypothetical protein Zmor_016498 [Zophobas morio]|uniref:C2H2-type domain-containing protein n=1 Tax=Zophobas morio TaxID=2755281 RepID=A0AA38I7J2_9CUCU|nr:hypothetical protein Zmor_016498 [Zophobas morio]